MTQFIDVSLETSQEKKETIFTEYLSDGRFVKVGVQSKEFVKILYLGKCILNSHLFCGQSRNGDITILKGTKGDEFNNQ